MFPTKEELLEMFDALIETMSDEFGKESYSKSEHVKVYLRNKDFCLILFGNFEKWRDYKRIKT